MTLLVRDDRRAVEYNIAYHLRRGVDYIIATDNGSTDGARDVLLHYQKLGVLHLIDEPADDYSQPEWVARMARIAYEKANADWIMHVDVDEYWWPLSGDLKDGLRAVGSDEDIVKAPRFNFWTLAEPQEPFWRHMTYRDVRHSINVAFEGGALPPKICHRGVPEVELNMGNHKIRSQHLAGESAEQPFVIFHFPYRSYEQLQEKVKKGGRALLANKQLDHWAGGRWRQLYDLYLSGQLEQWYQAIPKVDSHAPDFGLNGQVINDTRLRDFMETVVAQDQFVESGIA